MKINQIKKEQGVIKITIDNTKDKIVRIIKLKELEDAYHPNNIEEGYERIAGFVDVPILGERFWLADGWSTSGVQEIINPSTFRRYNSIYKWEFVNSKK